MFSAMLMAVVDGIQNKIDPGAPLEQDIYEMTSEDLKEYRHTPASLEEALEALETACCRAEKRFLQLGIDPDLREPLNQVVRLASGNLQDGITKCHEQACP